MIELAELEDMLVKAPKGSRRLSHAIDAVLHGKTLCEYTPCEDGHGTLDYTQSLDDAIALVEEAFPDHHYLVNFRASRIKYAGDTEITVSDSAIIWVDGKEFSAGKPTGNAALSLCIAVIRAKQKS